MSSKNDSRYGNFLAEATERARSVARRAATVSIIGLVLGAIFGITYMITLPTLSEISLFVLSFSFLFCSAFFGLVASVYYTKVGDLQVSEVYRDQETTEARYLAWSFCSSGLYGYDRHSITKLLTKLRDKVVCSGETDEKLLKELNGLLTELKRTNEHEHFNVNPVS